MTFDQILDQAYELIKNFVSLFSWASFLKYSVLFVLIIGSYFVVRLIVNYLMRLVANHLPAEIRDVTQYFMFYGLYGLFLMILLQTMGIELSAIVAAAGVTGIAIGFAAKTSLSNIISGIMLLFEQSFRIGDLINCNGVQGRVQSIDLLSVTLKTIDNTAIRVPNEKLIDSTLINKNAFKTRRICFAITIDPNGQDVKKVLDFIMQCAQDFPNRVKSVEPDLSYDVTSAHALGLTLAIWVPSGQVVASRSAFVKTCSEQSVAQSIQVYVAAKP